MHQVYIEHIHAFETLIIRVELSRNYTVLMQVFFVKKPASKYCTGKVNLSDSLFSTLHFLKDKMLTKP